MRLLLLLALGLVALWVLLVVLAYAFQRRLQYFPATDAVAPPFAEIEEVRLETADGVAVLGWYWPGRRDGTILLFHGNAGDRGDRVGWMAPLHELGWPVFFLDYRGYGGSEGAPTEAGLIEDGLAAAAWLRGRGKVAYFGESLGASVAVAVAAREPPDALVLQSGADSLARVASKAYPFLPIGLLMKDRFDSAERIAEVRCPSLFLHGTRDTLIPIEMGRALFDAANEPKEFFAIAGGGHNDLSRVGGRRYYERVEAFLSRTLS